MTYTKFLDSKAMFSDILRRECNVQQWKFIHSYISWYIPGWNLKENIGYFVIGSAAFGTLFCPLC